MLMMGVSNDRRTAVVIKHLPVPDRKNLFKVSGPPVHLTADELSSRCAEILGEYLEERHSGVAPKPSPLETITQEEKEKLFRGKRFVAVVEIDRQLKVYPTHIDVATGASQYSPKELACGIEQPLTNDGVWGAVLEALSNATTAER